MLQTEDYLKAGKIAGEIRENVRQRRFVTGVLTNPTDEYLDFPDWRNHEFKVWAEFVEKNNVKFEYIAIGTKGMVSVKVLDIGTVI